MTVYLDIPFTGEYDATWGYAHDDSGLCGATMRWPCRDEATADIMRRIFDGDLDASPARRHFATGPDPVAVPVWRRLDRTCTACGVRQADGRNLVCVSCRMARRTAARRRVLARMGQLPLAISGTMEVNDG